MPDRYCIQRETGKREKRLRLAVGGFDLRNVARSVVARRIMRDPIPVYARASDPLSGNPAQGWYSAM